MSPEQRGRGRLLVLGTVAWAVCLLSVLFLPHPGDLEAIGPFAGGVATTLFVVSLVWRD